MFKLFQKKRHLRGYHVSGWKAPLGRFIPERGQTATVFHHRANRGPHSLELYFYQIFICLVYGLLKTWAHHVLPATRLPGCANTHLPLFAHSLLCGRMSPQLSRSPPTHTHTQGKALTPPLGLFLHQANLLHKIGSHRSGRKLLLFPQSRGPVVDAVDSHSTPLPQVLDDHTHTLIWRIVLGYESCLVQKWYRAYLPPPQG